MNSALERFNEIALHDSLLLRIVTERREDAAIDELQLDLRVLLPPDARRSAPARLRFVNCAGVTLSLDFWGKRVCGDSIANAACEPLSDELATMLDQNVRRQLVQPMSSLLVFTLSLCPPGGEIRVIAQDFEMQIDP